MSINYDKYISSKDHYYQKKLPEIMDNLDNTNKFNDKYFPKDESSIVNKKNPLRDYEKEFDGEDMKIYEKERNEQLEEYKSGIADGSLKWERISNIINIKYDQSEKFLINQNFLGDCYFISFLRSLQKFHPEKYYLFFGTCFPEIGYYEIYLFNKDGEQTKVFVDDYILVKNDFIPYFASLKEKDVYTVGINLLIEKAFAKMNGSYFNITGGYNGIHGTFALVGISPALLEEDFLKKDNDYIYNLFEEEINSKNIVTCGTINEDSSPIKGLFNGHMYSLFSIEKNSDLNILKLNNPHGMNDPNEMEQFKLHLNEKYKNIEEEIIEYNIKNVNNGNLKIDIDNFKKHFDLVEICEFIGINLKKKVRKKNKNLPDPILPPGNISEAYNRRKNILDSLGIPKSDQNNYFNKFNGNIIYALYILFKMFMEYGSSRETFYNIILGTNNNSQSSFPSFLNYFNQMNLFSHSKK